MIKAVVFDFEGVYFEKSTENFLQNLIKQYGIPLELIKEVYLKSNEMDLYKRGKMTGDEFWTYATKKWDITAKKDEILNVLASSYEENETIITLIKNLKAQGIKIGACTNNFEDRIEFLENKFHFLRNFDVFVTSYELGVRKPDPLVFQTLLVRLNTKPEKTIFVDDMAKNEVALKNMGFDFIMYESQQQLLQEFSQRGIIKENLPN